MPAPKTGSSHKLDDITQLKGNRTIVVGDRIAWLDLTATPRYGEVKWIGNLEGHGTHVFAGIDFVS